MPHHPLRTHVRLSPWQFGETDNFELIPAVRHPTGGNCVDETGCDFEKITACAFDGVPESKQVSFLACMDEQRVGTPQSCAQTCAIKDDLHYNAIEDCFNGPRGNELLANASKAFNDALPGSTTIPHTFVNTADVQPSYTTLKLALCQAGSSAKVCKSLVEDADGLNIYRKCTV